MSAGLPLPIDRSDSQIERASRLKMNFSVLEMGGSRIVQFYGNGNPSTSFRYSDSIFKNSGAHLCKFAYNEVEKRVISGEYVPKNKDNDRESTDTICFHPINIRSFTGFDVDAIDVSGCYWDTLYLIGAISKKLRDQGWKKDREWKMSRAAAIGSLGAQVTCSIYKGGIMEEKPFIYRRKYNVVRLDVIDNVWKVFMDIAQQVEPGLCMFLTDCFFVEKEYSKKVQKLLKKAGYKYKLKKIHFEDIQLFGRRNSEYTYLVKWHTEKKPEKIKFMNFNSRHSWKNALERYQEKK
jgi:hypothetical protein